MLKVFGAPIFLGDVPQNNQIIILFRQLGFLRQRFQNQQMMMTRAYQAAKKRLLLQRLRITASIVNECYGYIHMQLGFLRPISAFKSS